MLIREIASFSVSLWILLFLLIFCITLCGNLNRAVGKNFTFCNDTSFYKKCCASQRSYNMKKLLVHKTRVFHFRGLVELSGKFNLALAFTPWNVGSQPHRRACSARGRRWSQFGSLVPFPHSQLKSTVDRGRWSWRRLYRQVFQRRWKSGARLKPQRLPQWGATKLGKTHLHRSNVLLVYGWNRGACLWLRG